MRLASKLCTIGMWIALVVYVLIQAGTMLAIERNNAALAAAGRGDEQFAILPLLCVTVLMILGVVLFTLWKKRRYIGLIVAALAAVGMLLIALELGRAFPVRVTQTSTDQGLDTFKLILRHIGIALVPLLMLLAWRFRIAAEGKEAFQEALKKEPAFDLSGASLTGDTDGSAGEGKRHPLKRSLKKRREKEK